MSALLILCCDVLNLGFPWTDDIKRPAVKRRIPNEVIRNEVAAAIAQMEGIRLRVNDVDFERRVIVSSLFPRDTANTAQHIRGHFTNSLEAAT